MPKKNSAVTLLELLISIVLFSIIFIGFVSLDLFGRHHIVTADQRAKMQNEISFVLEHMTKTIRGGVCAEAGATFRGGAIGDINTPAIILPATIGTDKAVLIWIDFNNDGRRDASDKQVAYSYNAARHEIRFYPNYTDASGTFEALTTQDPRIGTGRILSDFSQTIGNDTYIVFDNTAQALFIRISARWNPNMPESVENTQISQQTQISLLSSSFS